MSERTRLGLSVLGAGIALGIGADLLLRETPWGLNWALWAACLGVAAVVAARIARFEAPRAWPWLLAVGVLFSTCLAWRASPVLAAETIAGPFPAATEIEWKDTPRGRWSGHAGAAARGFGIALPPTILSHLDDVPRAERRFLVSRLEGEADDWRSWSLSRSRAQDALDDYARSVAAASR